MLLSLVMAGILLLVAASAQADEGPIYPIGEITIEAKQLAAGVGYSWGDGVMNPSGKSPLKPSSWLRGWVTVGVTAS